MLFVSAGRLPLKFVKVVGKDGVDCIHLVPDKDRWQIFCEYGNELSSGIKCLEFLDSLRNSTSQVGFCSKLELKMSRVSLGVWRIEYTISVNND